MRLCCFKFVEVSTHLLCAHAGSGCYNRAANLVCRVNREGRFGCYENECPGCSGETKVKQKQRITFTCVFK